jgi:hypothetical protein
MSYSIPGEYNLSSIAFKCFTNVLILENQFNCGSHCNWKAYFKITRKTEKSEPISLNFIFKPKSLQLEHDKLMHKPSVGSMGIFYLRINEKLVDVYFYHVDVKIIFKL